MKEEAAIKFFREQLNFIENNGANWPLKEPYEIIFKMAEELKRYRTIGTIEECREAMERKREKKPVLDAIYRQQYYCPNCEDFIAKKNGDKPHHCTCGQAIDWSGVD